VLAAMGLKSVFLSARPIVLSLARSTMPSSTTLFSNNRKVQRARPLGRLGTGQGNQLGLLLAVKNPSNGRHRAAACGSTRPRSLLPPVVCAPGKPWMAGFQSFDDPLVAPPFASFRDIGLQQDPRLEYPARRALSFPNQGFKPFAFLAASRTTYFFTEISFAAMIASLASRWRRKRITKSFQIG